MKDEKRHFFRFKAFRLDVEERQLLQNNLPVPLTPKAFDVLAVLVQNSGHLVEKEELLHIVWSDSFVEEANIARIIHTLRKVLGDDGSDHKYIETIATKGYRFVAKVTEVSELPATRKKNGNGHSSLAENLRLSNFVSAANETRFGIPNPAADKTVVPSISIPKSKTQVILFGIGFLSAIILLFLLSFNFKSDSSGRPSAAKSIAVLPLKPINTANRDEIYEIGIADSIIHYLSATKNYNVRPLSATRKYVSIEQDPVAAGLAQKVDFVLASNYQLANGKIRVTSQLINVSTERIEDTFQSSEIDATNVFTMQDTIAGEVGTKLLYHPLLAPDSPNIRWKLGNIGFSADSFETSSSRIGTENEEAYRLYLQGKNLSMKRNAADHKKAIEYFEQAIRLDPNYARAYAGMARAYLFSRLNNSGRINSFENEKVRENISKALELDQNLAEAYVARADFELIVEWNFPAVEKDLATAIELEPNNDSAHWLYALLLAYRSRFDEALREIEIARAIDPGALMYMRDRGRILYYARRYDEAIVQFKQVLDLDKNFESVYGWLGYAYAMKGDEAQASENFINVHKRANSDRVEIYQKIYKDAGWQGIMRKSLEFAKLDEQMPGSVFYPMAILSAQLGEKDQAFEYLNKAVERREWRIIMLNVDPPLDSLRDDPRFAQLVTRAGLR